MNLSYKYRLYPTDAQAKQLDFLLWQGRKIWNGALEMWQTIKEETGKSPSKFDVSKHWAKVQRNAEPETLGQLPYDTVAFIVDRLAKAYKAAWTRYERGQFTVRRNGSKNYGFPRFKRREQFNSLPYRRLRFVETSARWGKLRVMNVGEIRVRYHRPLPEDVKTKIVIIMREGDKWYAAFQIEFAETTPPPHPGTAIGIDMGLVHVLALSDGTFVDKPRWLIDDLPRLRVLQRKLDRQRRANNPDCFSEDGTPIKGKHPVNQSVRMRETERAITKLHADIKQRRWYFWHVVTDDLTRTYSRIVLEDLTPEFMLKNKRLAKFASDAAWGMFRQMLTYKATERGVEIVTIPPAYTSQMCSECGHIEKENRPRQDRFCCVECGFVENADTNAARNILNAAL